MVDCDQLRRLYLDIQNCHVCPHMDGEKALRLVDGVNAQSDVFIISQTLAANQLRKSGVNFFQADGRLGNTGKSLEGFLTTFGRTVYPKQPVMTSSGSMIPKCEPGYVTAYNTEIAQCYPGKSPTGRGDRTASSQELRTCVGRGFLVNEMELIGPRLLLLMGKASRDTFFDYVLEVQYPESLTEHIQEIVHARRIPLFKVGELSLYVLPIQHASGANPRFRSMLQNHRLIEMVKEVLYD